MCMPLMTAIIAIRLKVKRRIKEIQAVCLVKAPISSKMPSNISKQGRILAIIETLAMGKNGNACTVFRKLLRANSLPTPAKM